MLNDFQQNVCKKLIKDLGINSAIIKDLEGSFVLFIGDDPCLLHLCDKFFESQDCPVRKEVRDEIKEKGVSKKCSCELLHIGAPVSINDKHIAIVFTPAWRLSEEIPYEKLNERIKGLSEEEKKEFFKEYTNIPLIISGHEEDIKSKIRVVGNVVAQFIKSEEIAIINELLLKIISSKFDWKEVITTIQNKAREITKAERSCILLLNRKTNELDREFHCDQYEKKKKHCHTHAKPNEEGGAIGEVFRTGQPLLIKDTKKENKWLFSEDINSELDIPLISEGETIGVLHVAHKENGAFNQWHQTILTIFAGEAAISIKNASLFNVLSSLEDIGLVLSSELKLDELLEIIGNKAKEVLGTNAIVIYSYEQETCQFQLEYQCGVNKPEMILGPIIPEKSVKLKAIEKGEYFASDSENDPIMGGNFVKREGIKSSVVLPLKVEDKTIGVMFVNYRSKHSFSKEEETIHKLFAFQIAVAIKNAHLFKEIDTKRQKTDLLSRVSVQVQAEEDLDKMLYTILTAITIGEGLAFNRAMLFLKDGDNLKGKMAIGPVSNEEANEIWTKATQQKITFSAYILQYEETREILLNTTINMMIKRLIIPLGIQSIFSQSFIDGNTKNIKNAEIECPEVKGIMGDLSADAFAITPLIVKDKAIGLIVADRKCDRRPITSFDLDMLSTFAHQAEIAIEKKRLFDEINSRIKSMDELYETMIKIGRPSSSDDFLKVMCNFIVGTIRVNCSIYQYKKMEDKLVLQIYEGIDKPILARREYRLGEGIPGKVATTKKPIMGDTFIGVSIKRADEFFGVLVVNKPFYELFEPFKENEKKFVQIVEEYIALNMTNFALIQKLEEETRAKSEILHHLSHTMRSPLGVLEMYSNKLLEHRVREDKMDRYLKTISYEAKECLEILENLVNTSLIDRGKIEIIKEELDISSIINETCDKFSESLEQKVLSIKRSIPPSIRIAGDKVKIGIAIYNIINNAIKFSEERKKILINLYENGDNIKVEIINYGPIIPEEERERIFEKFYQGKPEEGKMPKKGMGLGLFIAYFYIKAHNGRIWVETSPKETKFIFILPKKGGVI